MSQNTPNGLIPPKPAAITLDTLPQLFAHHRARFGGWSMTTATPENEPPAPPERPDGISEEEWTALGDPGKAAIQRERAARQKAESDLAAARARPAPPKNTPPAAPPAQLPSAPAQPPGAGATGDQPDLAALVQQAVAAAIQPLQEAETQRQAETAANKVRDAVTEAAKKVLHDSSDAIANIDLTKVVNDQGQADPEKVKTEIEDLLKRKPHLGKGPRTAPPGIGGGAPATATDADKVKAVLADMQKGTGVRPPATTN